MISAETNIRSGASPDAPRQYRIALIDDRQLVAESFALSFQVRRPQDLVACYSNVIDWIASTDHDGEDTLVLMSIGRHTVKDPQITSALTALKEARPGVAVVVMGDDDNAGPILDALDLGARGYIPTNVSLDVAVEAIILVAVGGKFIPANSLISARGSFRAEQPMAASTMGEFTARQVAVVNALRQGKANKIIAYELNMRESTVKVHVRNIMRKLKARNRTEVAFIAHSSFQDAPASAPSASSASAASIRHNGEKTQPIRTN